MSGTPTEAEIQAQWRAAIDVLENVRNFADGTLCGGGGKFDVLLQLLEGDYLPAEYATLVNAVRSGVSTLVSPGVASQIITPALFEYARLLKNDATLGFGSGFRSPAELFRALYEWFVANALRVKSRAITYAGAVAGGTNVGNGVLSRLTVDENAFNLEACNVEKKAFRVRSDQNNGVSKWAEVFEFVGVASSFDNLLRASFGSGEAARTTIVSKHAGSSSGGSLLTNSSFSEFNSASTPKFNAWNALSGNAQIDQDTTAGHQYRSFPGEQTSASLKITGGGGLVTLSQNLSDMNVSRLDPNTPYFLRVMLNKTIGTASGGSVTIRLGSKSATVTIAALAANWAELIIPIDQNLWFRKFNQDALTIQIEWSSSASGFLLVDDAIFCPWDLIDGTYWLIRQNANVPVAWLVDDTMTCTDTGGAPATGKIQWWNWVAGFGCLPSSGSPTFVDP
jgi:hypothetical protein